MTLNQQIVIVAMCWNLKWLIFFFNLGLKYYRNLVNFRTYYYFYFFEVAKSSHFFDISWKNFKPFISHSSSIISNESERVNCLKRNTNSISEKFHAPSHVIVEHLLISFICAKENVSDYTRTRIALIQKKPVTLIENIPEKIDAETLYLNTNTQTFAVTITTGYFKVI